MLAVRLHPDRQLRLHDEPMPVPAAGQALLRITAVGLCGSDRHWMVDGRIGEVALATPLVLGHEFAAVATTGRFGGQRVAVDPADPCGVCDLCRSDRSNLCQRIRFAGHGQVDGALREWMAWSEDCLHAIADHVTDAEAALVEPLAVAIHALDLAHLREGETAAVVGCGPIGVLLVGLARRAGASVVIATDPLRHRLALAEAFGADVTRASANRGEDSRAILEATSGRGCDVVFEAAGEQQAVDTAVDVAAPGSRVVLVGIPSDDRTSFEASTARRKGLTLRLARRSTPDSFRRAVELAESGQLGIGRLISEQVGLAETPSAIERFVTRSGMKVVVKPGAEPSTGAR
jgi:L-iditol 2-dehydrogenase